MSNIDKISGYETIPPQAKNFPIKIRKYGISGGVTPHWHEHLEMLFFLSGHTSVIVNGKTVKVSPGDVIVVNGTEVHSFLYAGELTEYLCLIIYPKFFSDIDAEGTLIENYLGHDATALGYAKSIYDAYTEGGAVNAMRQKSLAYALMSYLTENYVAERMTEQRRQRRTAALDRLDSVLEYVSLHHGEPLTTRDLAAVCYLSESQFCRFFKSATGKSALEYVSEYRIERAAVLLSNTDLSISEIAAGVGFLDQNYFSRIFKRHKGMTPKEYRASSTKE